MASSDAVWGIDIGQCALKALRCRPHEDGAQITVDAFDYIEYPKILSQPEADPAALIADAITLFLSRNNVRGDSVAISVPGQNGLARFIKLPPVESRKIPDIVKYEARQQIPFSLEDVVWDYQKMVGGSEEEGFALETEVGLFAMKRDQVYRSLKPFTDAGIEVDIVQLTPLALYNYVVFDQMQDLPPPSEYDADNPLPSLVVLALGTDSTDLVVTNGYRVWQRSIPIGGSHFTKSLTKELKLTFASAEHLKRNAAKAEDPKQVFQAMRPVFNDLLTEVQRSIGYFANLDRRAKIGRVLALGNAMKLPGLQRYLAQNLGFEFSRVESYRGLSGAAVVDAPAFKENILSFCVCYGLGVQGLKAAKIKTNLLPRELIKDRMIRDKKPWAVAAAAALLLGCTISFFGYWRAWSSVALDVFRAPMARADQVVKQAQSYQSDFDTEKKAFEKTAGVGQNLVSSDEHRTRWLQMIKAVDLCLPRDASPPAKFDDRQEIHILSIQSKRFDDLTSWWTAVQDFDRAEPPAAPMDAAAPPTEGGETPPADANALNLPPITPGPSGAGWVVEVRGYHFHNKRTDTNRGDQYVRNTLVKNLKDGVVPIPADQREPGWPTVIDLKKLGITHPVLIGPEHRIDWDFEVAGPESADPSVVVAPIKAPKFDFVLQFCWQDVPTAVPPPSGEAAPAEGTSVPAAPAEPPPPMNAPAAETPPMNEAEPPMAVPPADTPPGDAPPPMGTAPMPPASEESGGAAPAVPPMTPPEGAPPMPMPPPMS